MSDSVLARYFAVLMVWFSNLWQLVERVLKQVKGLVPKNATHSAVKVGNLQTKNVEIPKLSTHFSSQVSTDFEGIV